jgi:hypothetical protein
MTLKDLLHKKSKAKDESASGEIDKPPMLSPNVPEFTFMRTTTHTQETFEPPTHPGDPTRQPTPHLSPEPRGFVGRLRRHSNAAPTSPGAEQTRFAERIHFGRSRSGSSVNVPANLPEVGGDGVARNEEEEARWEKRATVLVTSNAVLKSGNTTPNIEVENPQSPKSRVTSAGHVPDDVGTQLGKSGSRTEADVAYRLFKKLFGYTRKEVGDYAYLESTGR